MRVGQSSARAAASTNGRYGLAYYRVSTSEQANTSYDDDGFSIQAQRDYCQRKAAELGVQLVDEFIDRGKSARTADRPGLQAMLARVKEDLDIQYVFVHKLDRLARNREDDVQIGLQLAKNSVRLVSCTENIDETPSGKLVHGIMADIAEWYSANLSEEAKKGLRKKVEVGGTPYKAPVGYVNTRLKIREQGKNIGIVQVHEQYGQIITECFRLYDSGQCTLSDVAAYANDHGLRMPATKALPEQPITVQRMHRILHNRYYVGWVTFGGVEYKGEHPALIDEATFNRVQALLAARDLNKDKSRKRPHHLKGVLCCAYCGRRLGISAPMRRATGISHAYFYCLGHQRDTDACPQRYLPVSEVERAVHDYWSKVRIAADRIRALRQAIIDEFAGKHEQGQSQIARQKRRIIELEQRRKKAKAAYYADVLDLNEFKAEQETVKQGIKAAEAIIARWSVELAGITKALDDALQLVTNPQALYEILPEALKGLLVQTVFEKIWIMETRVVGSNLTQPFAELVTLEARLASGQLLSREESDGAPPPAVDESTTYHRTRTSVPTLHAWSNSWGWTAVERPHGPLAVDIQNLDPTGGRGSNMRDLVGLRGYKLNNQLATFVRDVQPKQASNRRPLPQHNSHTKRRLLRDRLDKEEVTELVRLFKAGASRPELAARFKIGLSSVKKLLRQRGVKRKSRYGILS